MYNVESKNAFEYNGDKQSTTEPTTASSETNLSDLFRDTAAELANDVELNKVSDASESQQLKSTTSKELETATEKKGKRRGVWKRVRVRPVDSFETAESQNIGKHFFNSLVTDQSSKDFGERYQTKSKADKDEEADQEEASVTEVSPSSESSNSTDSSPNYKNEAEVTSTKSIADDAETTTQTIETEAVTLSPPEATTLASGDTNIGYTAAEEADESVTVSTPRQTEAPVEAETEAATTAAPAATDSDEENESPTETPDIEVETSESQRKSVTVPANGVASDSNSIMDEVKQRLTELFSFDDDDVVVSTTERVFRINRNFNRPKPAVPHYMTIDRHHAVNEIISEKDAEKTKEKTATMKLEPVPVLKTFLKPVTEQSSFHKDLMDSVIFATSTSTEISHETEICYRGRCVKTQQKP